MESIDDRKSLPSNDPAHQQSHGVLQSTETTNLISKRIKKPAPVHYRDVITATRFKFLFWSVIFGSCIAFFDTTLMASSHPVITSYFNASNSASWLSTVFYLTSTVFNPIYGSVSDTIGRRSCLLFAVVVFFGSTLWCGFAGNIGSFIAARALTGLGAGGVIAMASILTSDIVKIEYRGIYQSYFNLVSRDSSLPMVSTVLQSNVNKAYGTGHGLGAAMGGILCDRLGWRAAFYVQLPFIATFGILAILACPSDLGPNLAKTEGKSLREVLRSFDVLGTIVMIFTVSGLILGLNLGGNVLSWSSPVVIVSLVIAAIGLVLLVPVERKAVRPVLPIRLFTIAPVANVMFSNFFASMTTATVLFNAPLYLQTVKQTSPTTSGLFMVPPIVGAAGTAISAGIYITYTRRMKPPLVLGAVSGIAGAVTVACLSADTPINVVPWLVPWASIGQGFFFPSSTIAVLALNSQDHQAMANVTLTLIRNLGSIHGIALSSWILQNALPRYLNKYVTASNPGEKARIVRLARKSIQAIRFLDPSHKKQVIEAYAPSLRATFIFAVASATCSAILILPARLPHLQEQADMDEPEEVEEDEIRDANLQVETSTRTEEETLLRTPTNSIARTDTRATTQSGRPPLSRRSTSYDVYL
jgi:MFS family permease